MVSKTRPVNFFDHLDQVEDLVYRRDILVFLDYDGTLTPIVATPDLAVMSEQMRDRVNAVSRTYRTAIVSGRATDDVSDKVGLKHLYYAGSHGFEILFPDGTREVVPEAKAMLETVKTAHKELAASLEHIKYALAEHVKFTISAHYRLVDERDLEEFFHRVEKVLSNHPDLKRSNGKKVVELKPNIDWHKGKAVGRLQKELDPKGAATSLYIGDDTTDEDAFAEIAINGVGIVVTQEPRESFAKFQVKTIEDVAKILDWLVNR